MINVTVISRASKLVCGDDCDAAAKGPASPYEATMVLREVLEGFFDSGVEVIFVNLSAGDSIPSGLPELGVEDHPFPVVVVNGELISSGDIPVSKIITAVEQAMACK